MLIGQGNTSVIYKGTYCGEECAIKTVPIAATQLSNENEFLNQLQHPFIIKLLASGQSSTDIIYIYELLDYDALTLLNASKFGLNEDIVRIIGFPVCCALKYIHSRGIAHRDVKPANILLSRDNVKLADWGFAAYTDQPFNDKKGSPIYMAPEIYSQSTYHGPPADIWALGVTLYQLKTNTYPFGDKADDIDELKNEIFTVTPFLSLSSSSSSLTIDLRETITSLLTKDPSLRPSASNALYLPFFKM